MTKCPAAELTRTPGEPEFCGLRDIGVIVADYNPGANSRRLYFHTPMHASSTQQDPLVSVVVPAWNAERTIVETLRSLLSQTYQALEIVVVDDGSSDSTADKVKQMATEFPQLRLILQPNRGVAAARNAGVRSSRGEYVAAVDADDLWFPEAAQMLVTALGSAGPDVAIAYGWSLTIDERGQADGGQICSRVAGRVYATLLCHNFIGNASATMFRRTAFDAVGGYDSRFHEHGVQGCEDWDLYLRLAESYRFCVVPQFLVGYRKSGDSMSAALSSMAESHGYLLQKAKDRHPRIPSALTRLSTSSFYIHLAKECRNQANSRESYRWWRRALGEGRLFTVIHPETYGLAASVLMDRLRPSGGKRLVLGHGAKPESAGGADSVSSSRFPGTIPKLSFRSRIRLLLQGMLHAAVRRVPATYR